MPARYGGRHGNCIFDRTATTTMQRRRCIHRTAESGEASDHERRHPPRRLRRADDVPPLHRDTDLHAHTVRGDPRRRGHRSHRCAVRRRRDESYRRTARTARNPQPVLAHAPHQPGDEGRAFRSLPRMRCRRRHDQEPVSSRVEPRRDPAGIPPAARGRGHPHRGGRRSLDHPAHLPGHREGPAGRHGALRCALRHPRRLPGFEVPPRRAVPTRGRRGPPRSEPHNPDRDPRGRERHRRVEVQPRQRDARGLHGRAVSSGDGARSSTKRARSQAAAPPT